ncbi:MAG: hypothetical protein ACYC5Y_02180 [Symbiobacteriia bacterium]
MAESAAGYPALLSVSDPRLQRAAAAVAERLAEDPAAVAVGIFGSAVEGRSWDRSDVDLWLIHSGAEPKHAGAELLEQGVNVSFQLVSRDHLPGLVEQSRGSALCRTLATARWLWCKDPQVEQILARVRSFPEPWRQLRILHALDQIKARAEEAEKLHFLGEPLGAVEKLTDAFAHLARLRLVRRGVYPSRDPIGEVLLGEPSLIQQFRDLTEGVMPLGDRIEQAVEYLDEAAAPLAAVAAAGLEPLLAAGPRTADELDEDETFSRARMDWTALLGWLVTLGLLRQGTRPRAAGLPLAGYPEIVYSLPA